MTEIPRSFLPCVITILNYKYEHTNLFYLQFNLCTLRVEHAFRLIKIQAHNVKNMQRIFITVESFGSER